MKTLRQRVVFGTLAAALLGGPQLYAQGSANYPSDLYTVTWRPQLDTYSAPMGVMYPPNLDACRAIGKQQSSEETRLENEHQDCLTQAEKLKFPRRDVNGLGPDCNYAVCQQLHSASHAATAGESAAQQLESDCEKTYYDRQKAQQKEKDDQQAAQSSGSSSSSSTKTSANSSASTSDSGVAAQQKQAQDRMSAQHQMDLIALQEAQEKQAEQLRQLQERRVERQRELAQLAQDAAAQNAKNAADMAAATTQVAQMDSKMQANSNDPLGTAAGGVDTSGDLFADADAAPAKPVPPPDSLPAAPLKKRPQFPMTYAFAVAHFECLNPGGNVPKELIVTTPVFPVCVQEYSSPADQVIIGYIDLNSDSHRVATEVCGGPNAYRRREDHPFGANSDHRTPRSAAEDYENSQLRDYFKDESGIPGVVIRQVSLDGAGSYSSKCF